jgi:hypothetical protein
MCCAQAVASMVKNNQANPLWHNFNIIIIRVLYTDIYLPIRSINSPPKLLLHTLVQVF